MTRREHFIERAQGQQPEDLEAVVDSLGLTAIIPTGHDASGPADSTTLTSPAVLHETCCPEFEPRGRNLSLRAIGRSSTLRVKWPA